MTRSIFVLAAAASVLALSACDDRPSRSDDDNREMSVQPAPPPVTEEAPRGARAIDDIHVHSRDDNAFLFAIEIA